MAVVDWTDPCARAGALSQAYYALLAGSAVVSVRARSGETDQAVEFRAADLATLAAEMRLAADECGRSRGEAPRRHAIRAG